MKTTHFSATRDDSPEKYEQLQSELLKTQSHLKAAQRVFDSLSDAVIINDATGDIWFANPVAVEILGFSPAGMNHNQLIERLKEHCADKPAADSPGLSLTHAVQGKSMADTICRISSGTGKQRHFSLVATPVEEKGMPAGHIIIGREETEQLDLLQRVEHKRAALQAIINSAPEGMVVLDEQARVIMMNPAAEKLLNGPVRYRTPVSDLPLLQADGEPFLPRQSPLLRSALYGEPAVNSEMTLRASEKQIRHLMVSSSPIRDSLGRKRGAVAILQDDTIRQLKRSALNEDREQLRKEVARGSVALEETVQALRAQIEEREQVERDLIRSQTELRRLSRRMLETLETDRQAVAKELHDSIGASLAAIKFSLEEKLAHIEKDTSHQAISLETILAHLIETIKETKRISARLRPTTLDDLGLLSTISWYCREFGALFSKIRVTKQIDLQEEDIPDHYKIVIYRIIQEAMNNAAKHASPETIRISLKMDHHAVRLCIDDNGQGFEMQNLIVSDDPLSGHGINGMRERAHICGGTFEMSSQIGVGTRVVVKLPLPQAD